jgi:hypothetical protein
MAQGLILNHPILMQATELTGQEREGSFQCQTGCACRPKPQQLLVTRDDSSNRVLNLAK